MINEILRRGFVIPKRICQNKKKYSVFMKVQQYLPQRKPMLLIDEIVSIEKNQKIITKTTFTGDEFFFKGHFPGNPICPGVITVEALGQTSIILMTYSFDETLDYQGLEVFAASVNDVKFKDPIRPKDTVFYHSTLVRKRDKLHKFYIEAFVNDTLSCKGEISLYINFDIN